ncbi:HNH endonuclease [Cupriavidus sp. DB3]|uniref:AP2 domain-containing protein n=1 Tax=Cupriavidus sp. DB3 TaxID=2873259 RepID=UPI001CF1F2C2|nr:HNH endonuclease [Cupriavidus sp. DB3]MCA7083411.1 HNH endonuclease [Cupriavidus sp. DB3]
MPKSIAVGSGAEVIVSDEDYAALSRHKWHLDIDGYARSNVPSDVRRQTQIHMHRVIAGLARGDRRYVDHINGNKLDNRRENLRICSGAENGWNVRLSKRNSSGYKGVSFEKRSGKWQVRIRQKGKQIFLGYYEFPEEAAHAYNKAAVRLHGEFAVLNPVGGAFYASDRAAHHTTGGGNAD